MLIIPERAATSSLKDFHSSLMRISGSFASASAAPSSKSENGGLGLALIRQTKQANRTTKVQFKIAFEFKEYYDKYEDISCDSRGRLFRGHWCRLGLCAGRS